VELHDFDLNRRIGCDDREKICIGGAAVEVQPFPPFLHACKNLGNGSTASEPRVAKIGGGAHSVGGIFNRVGIEDVKARRFGSPFTG
jgi:hypothetical protein